MESAIPMPNTAILENLKNAYDFK